VTAEGMCVWSTGVTVTRAQTERESGECFRVLNRLFSLPAVAVEIKYWREGLRRELGPDGRWNWTRRRRWRDVGGGAPGVCATPPFDGQERALRVRISSARPRGGVEVSRVANQV
jgi:hypothetical protein